MDGPSFKCGARGRAVPAGTIGIFLRPLPKFRRQIEARPHLQQLAIEAIHIRPVGAAQPDRFSATVSNTGSEIERRAADDVEHVGGGGLLLQRIAQLVGALLLGLEQPHVLDGDHRLVGESRQKRDVLLLNGRTSLGGRG